MSCRAYNTHLSPSDRLRSSHTQTVLPHSHTPFRSIRKHRIPSEISAAHRSSYSSSYCSVTLPFCFFGHLLTLIRHCNSLLRLAFPLLLHSFPLNAAPLLLPAALDFATANRCEPLLHASLPPHFASVLFSAHPLLIAAALSHGRALHLNAFANQ